jgi:hypothetical protein
MIILTNTKEELSNGIKAIEKFMSHPLAAFEFEDDSKIPEPIKKTMKNLEYGIPFVEQSPVTIQHDVDMENYPVDGYTLVTDFITVKPITISGSLVFPQDVFNNSWVNTEETEIPLKRFKWDKDGFGTVPKKMLDSFGAIVGAAIGKGIDMLTSAITGNTPPPFPPEVPIITVRNTIIHDTNFADIVNMLEYLQSFGWLFNVWQVSELDMLDNHARYFLNMRIKSIIIESVAGTDTHQLKLSMEAVNLVNGATFGEGDDNKLKKIRLGKKAPPREPEGDKGGVRVPTQARKGSNKKK